MGKKQKKDARAETEKSRVLCAPTIELAHHAVTSHTGRLRRVPLFRLWERKQKRDGLVQKQPAQDKKNSRSARAAECAGQVRSLTLCGRSL